MVLSRHISLALFLAGSLASIGAQAKDKPEIVKIYSGKNWNINDSVCFQRKNQIVTCGKVVSTTSYLVEIRVDHLSDKVHKGEKLYVSAYGPGRTPSSYGDTYVVTRTQPDFLHGITAGMFGSAHFAFPMVHIQTSLGKGFLLGFMPSFATRSLGTANASILGTFVTLEDYFSGSSFDGFSAMLATGLYSVRSTDGTMRDGTWLPAVQATMGWSYVSHGGFTIGLSAGLQFVSTADSGLIQFDWTGLGPIVQAHLGFSF